MAFTAAVLLTAILYMFNPLFLTILMQWIPYWLVERAQFIGQVVALVTIPGWLALVAEASLRTRAARIVFSMAVITGSMALFWPLMVDFYKSSENHQYMLQRARELREAVESIEEDRPLIATDSTLSLMLPAVRISAVMAPYLTHSNPADEGVIERHDDARELLSRGTSEERRRAIIANHGIDYVLIGPHRDRGANRRELDQSEFHTFDDLIVERHRFKLFRLGG